MTEEERVERVCAEEQPMPGPQDQPPFGYLCTLPYNHDGDHAAEDTTTGEIYAVWRRESLV